MSEGEQAPREFEPVEDPKEAHLLLREGVKTLASTLLWTKDQKHVLHTHLSHKSKVESLLYVNCPVGFEPERLVEDLKAARMKDCFFSVSLTRAHIFFKADLVGYNEAGLQFRVPEKVFKVQRRKAMRFTIPDGHILKVQFADPMVPGKTLEEKVVDLSAGGIGFMVKEDEEPMFTPGLVLKDLTFRIAGKTFRLDAEVRHCRRMNTPRYKGPKVGVLFKEIRASDSQFIAAYVFEETRKFFSTLL